MKPILCVENGWGTLCFVPVVGNPNMIVVFMDVNDDPRDYPPFYMPAVLLSSYLEQLNAKT